ncbi:hypothetical protein F5Y03DRAFT_352738 [Xylaria venustula]|nr:hypothetical protein F5Y03DRAFT_352738 [Xylaria venustula]
MPWATIPILEPRIVTEEVNTDIEAVQADGRNGDGAGSASPSPEPKEEGVLTIRPPSDHFTLHQLFYIFFLDGIGAAILSGGINLAIAYALYHDKGTNDSPIRLFQFPNTLAGDTAVTIFVQFLTTWVIESFLVNFDLRTGGVQAIGFIPEPKWRHVRWFMLLDRPEQTYKFRSFKHWFWYLYSQIIRSLLLAAVCFPLIFGVSVGLLTLVGTHRGNDWYYPAKWAPEIFKLVQGAALGLVSTPLMAIFWLARCGWEMQSMERRTNT